MIKHVDLYIENYGLSSFLYLEVPNHEELDQTILDKLKNTSQPGLLPLTALSKKEQHYIRYELDTEMSLEDFLSQKLSKEKLIACFSNLLETLLGVEESGLDLQHFLFDKQSIFIDSFSNRLLFLYIPIKNNSFEKVSLKDFLRELLYTAPYDESDDPAFFVRLHNYLIDFKDAELPEMIEDLKALGAYKPSTILAVSKKVEVTEKPSNYYRPGQVEVKTSSTVENGVHTSQYSSRKTDKKVGSKLEIEEELQYKRITRTDLDQATDIKENNTLRDSALKMLPKAGADFFQEEQEEEGTTVLGSSATSIEEEFEGTTMLGVENYSTSPPYLLNGVGNPKIAITKSVFKIGRDPKGTDHTCQNKVVGRVHAHILHENGQYFLEDNDSRNGSYVNDRKLDPKEKVKIRHEDRIRLANEEFVFKLF
ncbi:hypothetical protein JOC95_000284 [Bacillus tianshenii]|uniref:FHA domain-containing protein n=1 Tax=Sutcliffiella tianshenii TaxID=1463404 RepID=A0ABS2NV15_9BACI|nr:FHA domain-containing protein [Bacillus tianshenii]MBM7618442.1 hypothetical protein [Bacillus tianshenii]